MRTLFLIAGLSLVAFEMGTLHQTTLPSASQDQPTFDTLHAVGQHVLRHTNQIRRERSQTALQYDSMLAAVACAHTADMFRRGFFQHINPDGESPQDRAGQIHRRLYGQVGENLYSQVRIRKEQEALAAQMIEQWMNSPPHRKNLLRPSYTHLGVCVLQRADTLKATQLFAKIVAYLSTPLPKTAQSGDVLPISLQQPVSSTSSPVRYDFWDAKRDRIVSGPYVLTDSLRIPHTTGPVWSRFYILEPGGYGIYRGPKITITSP